MIHTLDQCRQRVLVATVCLMAMSVHPLHAFCVYNRSSHTVDVRVAPGDFGATLAPGQNACCNYANTDCNPSGSRTSRLTLQIQTQDGDARDYCAVVELQGGGYALLYEEDRSRMNLPPNLYCQSFTYDDQLYDYSNYGVHMNPRDVRFLISADCQYNNQWGQHEGENEASIVVNAEMLTRLQFNRAIRGIVYAGDLTQNTQANVEFQWYLDCFNGYFRFIFDGLGNHDQTSPDYWQSLACEVGADTCVDPGQLAAHVANNKHQTTKTIKGSPHYSWDWHDVHFVQLNLFPGSEVADGAGSDMDPHGSLSFLAQDLAFAVGFSRRPVILIHHFGFDAFSINAAEICDKNYDSSTGILTKEIWWSEAQRVKYWNLIASYNVAGIFAGHLHLEDTGDQTTCPWRIDWQRPSGATGGPDSIPTFISGAARNGVFLDVQMDDAAMRVSRNNRAGSVMDTTTVCLFHGQPLYVDAANAGIGGGTVVAPYNSVNNALAALTCSQSPAQFNLAAGTYHESLRIARPVLLRATHGVVTIQP